MKHSNHILHNKSENFGITNWPKCLAAIFGRPKYLSKPKYFLEPTTNNQQTAQLTSERFHCASLLFHLNLNSNCKKIIFRRSKSFSRLNEKTFFGRRRKESVLSSLAPKISSEDKLLRGEQVMDGSDVHVQWFPW